MELDNLFPNCISAGLTALVSEEEGVLKWQQGSNGEFFIQQGQSPLAAIPGDVQLDLRIFGKIPFKKVNLQVISPITVLVGGHSIGVVMNSEGVVTMGYSNIILEDGKKSCPAKDVGIPPGTAILNVEGTRVQSDTHLSYLIDYYARKKDILNLDVVYKGQNKQIKIEPIFCSETGRYRIGLLIQDGASGVGTLTFYDAKTKTYGALGHLITNSEANQSGEFKDGKIIPAAIQKIIKGEQGKIGEKVGSFAGKGASGNIDHNAQVGIFGILDQDISNPIYPEPVPVAMGHQIKEGPATMLTVLNDHTIEAFQISIQSVFPQPRSDGKAFIVKVTDQDLISRAGGIVQGMSGSPIIQNGKLVGAVTHVLVNDPTRGYGVLAEMMLEEAGLLPEQNWGNITGYYGQVSENRI